MKSQIIALIKACILGYISWKVFFLILWEIKARALIKEAKQFGIKERSKNYKFKVIPNTDLILSLDVTHLREHLIKGTFTSEDLVHVFAARCYTIGSLYNYTAQENFEEALQMAKIKDQELELARQNNNLESLPLLHGIPISIKDYVISL